MLHEALTSREVAALIGYSENTLRKSRCIDTTGIGFTPPPHFVQEGRVFYRLRDVKAWLKANPPVGAVRRRNLAKKSS